MTLRFVVTGCTGQLGTWLVREIERSPELELVRAFDLPEVDFADPHVVSGLFDRLGDGPLPDALLNASAFTAVDRCEDEEELAARVNAEAPRLLARSCQALGVRMVHVSTDFVFDGEGRRPYVESDPPRPQSAYGRTKLAGEQLVREEAPEALIVRTSWVFGPGQNFVRTLLGLAERRRRGEIPGPLRVVDDQQGCPTYSADLARGLLALVGQGAQGTFHLCNDGVTSWWGLARAAFDAAGYADLEIERIRAVDYPRPARTPMYSVLDCRKAESLDVRLRSWREALVDYLESPDSPTQ